MAKQKIELSELITGYKFPVTNFKLDSARVAAYIEAVDDTNTIFLNSNVVPPMSVVALAMAELSNSISFPDGAIHVSQELTFTHPVNEGETITSHAEVSRIQKRDSADPGESFSHAMLGGGPVRFMDRPHRVPAGKPPAGD